MDQIMMEEDRKLAETFPLLSTKDVGAIADWAVNTLGLTESWRAEEDGIVEHAELHWVNGKVSINVENGSRSGVMGVGLRLGSQSSVEAVYQRAKDNGCVFSRELAEGVIAYSFTALDPDGNEWWIHMETGVLDQLRAGN
jgi:uncharacterized glyoxalase superfamily protein PhnB